jgi:hypothetical protein
LRHYAAKILNISFVWIAFALSGPCAMAEDGKGIRFWNLTLHTITDLRMSPAGANRWGPNQCQNDRDGMVEHDERLRIAGIAPGAYDVRITFETGRRCIVRDIEARAGAIFSIEEPQLTDCGD